MDLVFNGLINEVGLLYVRRKFKYVKKFYMSNIFFAIYNTPGLCTHHVYLTRAYTLASKSGFFHITHKYFKKFSCRKTPELHICTDYMYMIMCT